MDIIESAKHNDTSVHLDNDNNNCKALTEPEVTINDAKTPIILLKWYMERSDNTDDRVFSDLISTELWTLRQLHTWQTGRAITMWKLHYYVVMILHNYVLRELIVLMPN